MPDSAAPAVTVSPRRSRRPVFFLLLALALVVGAVVGVRAFLHARDHEATDDAFVEGHVISISPKISAHVVAVHIDDNILVKKGDLLVELDPRDFEVARAQALASLEAARGRVSQAEAQAQVARAQAAQTRSEVAAAAAMAENASADLQRNEELNRKRVIDRRELDASNAQARASTANLDAAHKKVTAAEAQIVLAEAQAAAARGDLAVAQSQVAQAELQLTYTRLVAVEDGRITRKNVEPGAFVQPGQALFALVPPQVWVVANYKETQLKRMRPGQPVSVRVDAFPDRRFRGHVDSVQAGTGARFSLLPAENATGNYVKVVQRLPVKIWLDEAPEALALLAPGMSVEPEVNIAAAGAAVTPARDPRSVGAATPAAAMR